MRVLYGVCGEGMGHAMRSNVVAAHLRSRGHSVQFACSPGKAFQYISARWPTVSVLGLNMVMRGNRMDAAATFFANLRKHLSILAPFQTFVSTCKILKPDVVISDFDPWTARYAALFRVPLIAVDNIHFINRCRHPREVFDDPAAPMMLPVARGMVPDARRYLVTSLVSAEVCAPRTSLHQPIIRPEILRAPRRTEDFVVAYFNDTADHDEILYALRRQRADFRVYGTSVKAERRAGNITLCPFSQDGFIRDLASCRAVIGGAGFTLMSESVFLGKPMLAVPFREQFEQILNANYLGHIGYGARARRLDAATVGGFLENVPRYAERLAGYKHDGNVELLASVEEAIHGR